MQHSIGWQVARGCGEFQRGHPMGYPAGGIRIKALNQRILRLDTAAVKPQAG
jgi:hypothetical protein